MVTLDSRHPKANFAAYITPPQNIRMQIGGGRSLTSQERKELEDLKNLEPDYSLAPKPKEIDELKFPNLPNGINR